MMQQLAFAKINLTLDVLRADQHGMHLVDSILTPLALHDRLTLQLLPNTQDIQLSTSTFVEKPQDNLIFRAAKLLQTRFDVHQGVRIHLEKNIPIAAGLAGGSSDAAATLQALKNLWHLPASDQQLLELATLLGSDVPYCLYHKTMRAQGTGTVLSQVSPMVKTTVILFKPKDYGISARDAYAYIDEDAAFSQGHVAPVITALNSQDYAAICQHVYNCFEPVIMSRHHDLAQHRAAIGEIADAVLLSGSGPTIFAFAQSEAQISQLLAYGSINNLQTIKTATK